MALYANGKSFGGGTFVAGNVTGTASEDLQNLQIDDEIYSIPEGGGGVDYETTETKIGTYRGQDLYCQIVEVTQGLAYMNNADNTLMSNNSYYFVGIAADISWFYDMQKNKMPMNSYYRSGTGYVYTVISTNLHTIYYHPVIDNGGPILYGYSVGVLYTKNAF